MGRYRTEIDNADLSNEDRKAVLEELENLKGVLSGLSISGWVCIPGEEA